MVGCLFTDLQIKDSRPYSPNWFADSLHLHGALQWIADGSTPPDRLGVGMTGFRAVVQTGDPQFDYLLLAQSRANETRVNLDVAWDAAARVLAVERLDMDFPGENLVQVTAQLTGVDLSSPGAMQMSLTSLALTELDMTVQTHGLFEGYLLMPLGNMLLSGDGDMEAEVAALKAEATAAALALPEAQFSADTRAALATLIARLPNPAGTLTLSFRAEPGFGATRFAGYAMTGMPDSIAAAEPLLEGVTVEIEWAHADQR
jgi:hypothetical protein